ncbi:hypothetical protein CR513_19571, partial [Mucuna pruriens]
MIISNCYMKNQAVNALKIYLNEVERGLDKRVKVVRHNEVGKHLGPFAKLLQKMAVPKTPLELLTSRTPNLRHLHVCDCRAKIKIYNLQEKKLNARTINRYFIGYPRISKGYIFYCPNHCMRIVEFRNSRFIKNEEIDGSIIP